MDQDRFDALARAICRRRSRRQVLRWVLGGSAAGWLGSSRRLAGAVQEAPSCRRGLTYCSGSCVDLSSDYLNCGACGFACPSAGQTAYDCIGGACSVTGCATGFVDCGGFSCVDLSNDSLNCGACGTACASGVCDAGVCAAVSATDDPAAAGSGGYATASANGGAVGIGNVDSGDNVGNVVSVGDTYGPVWVDGGDVSNSTTIDVTADGGTAIADAGGGSGNVAVN
jgi:hypothetical protein